MSLEPYDSQHKSIIKRNHGTAQSGMGRIVHLTLCLKKENNWTKICLKWESEMLVFNLFQIIKKNPLSTHWKLFSLETSLVFHKQCTLKVAAQPNLVRPIDNLMT